MTYNHGKTFTLPNQYTALNGCVQYYTVEVVGKDFTVDKDAFLRFVEAVQTQAQPIITTVTATGGNSTVKFTLEQADVWGKSGPMQVSEKDAIADATEAMKLALVKGKVAADADITVTVEAVF